MRGKSLWIFSLGVQLHYAINLFIGLAKKFRKKNEVFLLFLLEQQNTFVNKHKKRTINSK